MTNETNAAPSVAEGEESELERVLSLLISYGAIHTVEGVKYPDGTHAEALAAAERIRCRLQNTRATSSPVDANKLVQTWIAQSPQSNVTDEDAEDLVLRVIAYGSSRQPSPVDRGIDAGNYEVASRLEVEICKLAGGMQSAAWPRIEIVNRITTALQSSAGVDEPCELCDSSVGENPICLDCYNLQAGAWEKAQAEINAVLESLGKDAVRVRENGGPEDIYASLAVSVAKLQRRVNAPTPSEAAQQAARETAEALADAHVIDPFFMLNRDWKKEVAEIVSHYCGTGDMK